MGPKYFLSFRNSPNPKAMLLPHTCRRQLPEPRRAAQEMRECVTIMQQCKIRTQDAGYSILRILCVLCKAQKERLLWEPRDLVSATKPSVGFSLNFQEEFFAKSSSRCNFHAQKSAHCDSHYLLKGVSKCISTRFTSAGGCTGRPARSSIGRFRIASKSLP